MKALLTRKRPRIFGHENCAKSRGTDICGPVNGRRVVPGKSKSECEAQVKPKKAKVESPSQSLKCSRLDGQAVSWKRKAECVAEVKPKEAKVDSSSESWNSSSEDDLYDVTYQVSRSRADLNSKYRELYKLGSGGSGSVFAGIRLQDAFAVAIKHIPRKNVYYKKVVQKGIEYKLIDEVALMVKVVHCPAVVPMLDCYEFPEEVIIVMERPYPALDLLHYKDARLGALEEKDAKLILRQLVEASIQMHNSGVFHRDLKLENILVELGHEFPKARVIDFGCGCLVREGTYDDFAGTIRYAPPELYSSRVYRAEPTTVYHLGTLLYELLHLKSFDTRRYLMKKRKFDKGLSKGCQAFLKSCLAKDPSTRPSFEELQRHPWFS